MTFEPTELQKKCEHVQMLRDDKSKVICDECSKKICGKCGLCYGSLIEAEVE